MTDRPPITVSMTAKSKAFRMYQPWQLERFVIEAWNGERGPIYRKGDSPECHIAVDDYAVVVVLDGDELVVVTQMHQHADYAGEAIYQPVDAVADVADGVAV